MTVLNHQLTVDLRIKVVSFWIEYSTSYQG